MSDKAMSPKIGAGVLAAAFRQGVSEIGQTLKAFPDAIQVKEPGQMFSPTQGEIAAARAPDSLQSRIQEARERVSEKSSPDKGLDRE